MDIHNLYMSFHYSVQFPSYDKGIEITKEEAELYDRILGKSHSGMAFRNKIWEGFDTRKPEGWDEAHKKN